METPLEYALNYISRGWRVHWTPPGRKHPTAPQWQKHATTDPKTVIQWFWAEHRDDGAGICIATGPESNLWVLDVDAKPGKHGDETLCRLERNHGALPDTHIVYTGSGGCHFYFTYEGIDFPLGNSAGRLGKDLDTRGAGGQVIAPPTSLLGHDPTHANAYRVIRDTPPAPAPAWLVNLLRPQWKAPAAAPAPAPLARHGQPTPYGLAALDNECANITHAADGTQNDTINRAAHAIAGLYLAGQLGTDAEWVKGRLMDAARQGNHPPTRALRTIESGWRTATPRQITPTSNRLPPR